MSPPPGALSAWLRAETRRDHLRVDEAYGRFDLGDRESYGAFLTAHARVTPGVEALLRPAELIGDWQGRTASLAEDLAALGRDMPEALHLTIPAGAGARWGALYVLEGSRLGGAVLARTLVAGSPHAFLGAIHAPGQWRGLLARLDRLALDRAEVAAGARATFSAFVSAAHCPD